MRVHWIAALTVLVLAGCGDRGPLTHDEFVSKAEAICADYNAKIEATIDDLVEGSTDEERAAALEDYARTYEDLADEVTDLEPPENDRTLARFLARMERNGRGFKEAADRGELMTDEAGNRASNSLTEARELADKAGLRECSKVNG